MRRHPTTYEANARLLLARLSEKHGRRLTLGTVPPEEWHFLAQRGFDLLWLMGVWQRSPGAHQAALEHPDLRSAYDALPGWTEDDVAGSPYAVHAYTVDPAIGENAELSQLKSRLNRAGLGLLLDFVPNHLALDHPWTRTHPDRFVSGTPDVASSRPTEFFSPSPSVHLAHGRDPHFPPWTDTAQVNFFSTETREALIGELMRIADAADGVRCDMAMLALNRVFEATWGWALPYWPRPAEEFWLQAIRRVRARHPDFLFLAEAYGEAGPVFVELGFDFVYDKPLYDLLLRGSPAEIRHHLNTPPDIQNSAARFIENHDERRAVTAFGRQRAQAAAVVVATLPGLRLFHDGQREGRHTRLPVQLVREPAETVDTETARFYDRLLALTGAPVFHDGEWTLMETRPAWAGSDTHANLLAWSWQQGGHIRLVVINYSAAAAQARLALSLRSSEEREVTLRDGLTDEMYVREVSELRDPGLYVDLPPWEAHVFEPL